MFEYKGIKINYSEYGKDNEEAIVFLHGWGQNIEMMEPIAKQFYNTKHVLILDLPGFGKSDEPTEDWDLFSYVEMIHDLLDSLGIKKPNLVGHSFGGKLSLIYATKYETRRLVLLGSPYKVKKKELSKKQKLMKKMKNVPGLNLVADFMKKHMGSRDYRNASPVMRNLLVKHVNTDISEDIKSIKCPTLIIWGTNDQEVPFDDAVELESIIKDSGLVSYEGCSHYAYLERLGQTNSVLKSFFK